MSHRRMSAFMCAALFVALSACGGGGGGRSPTDPGGGGQARHVVQITGTTVELTSAGGFQEVEILWDNGVIGRPTPVLSGVAFWGSGVGSTGATLRDVTAGRHTLAVRIVRQTRSPSTYRVTVDAVINPLTQSARIFDQTRTASVRTGETVAFELQVP